MTQKIENIEKLRAIREALDEELNNLTQSLEQHVNNIKAYLKAIKEILNDKHT